MSYAGALPTVWNGGRDIPLSGAALARLDSSVGSLARFLRTRAAERENRLELTAWSLSQMWAALLDLDRATITGEALREAVTADRDDTCFCWRESKDKLPHSLATAWVLFALALHNQPATAQEIEAFLKRQAPAGWWAMFPATPDDRNASTSATAFALLALHTQLERKLISPEQQPKVSAAIDRGANWLTNRAIPGKARWTEYPPEQTFERGVDYRGVSALAIHVLRAVKRSTQFDAAWLGNLPRAVPGPGESEQAKGYVFGGGTQFTIDDVRHYRYPWMLRATVDAYAGADLLGKARALLWLEEALNRAPTAEDLHSEVWTSAEVLFALRHVQSTLRRQSKGNAQLVRH